jgi:lambda family phage portal protein
VSRRPAKPAADDAQPTPARGRSTKATKPQQSAPLHATNRYDAAGMGRRMKGWNPITSGPNTALAGLQKIRDRSHDVARNDWAGASGVQHWTTNLIGTGIRARLKLITDKSKKERYGALWEAWCGQCDAGGVLDLYGQQSLATRLMFIDGEAFGRLRYRRPDFGMEVPLQVQVLEAQMLPMQDADSWPGMPQGHRMRSGIELDRIDRRVAYWFYREHPSDLQNGTAGTDQLVRVLADEVLHLFEPKRAGQLRGVPDFAPILARLRNISDFDDAVLERQKLANLFTAFIKRPAGTGMADDVDPVTGLPIQTDFSGTPMTGLEPGMTQILEPGDDIAFANPPEAGTTYSDYMRTQHLGTAAGQGLPYEILSGDIKEVSDRTLRVLMNEFRRFAEQRQWQVIIPMWCRRIRDAWSEQAVVSGQADLADLAALKAVEWAPQGWAYIHPVQDVQAKQTEVEAGFRSRSSVISERGDDPEVVDAEIAADKAREEELGITFGEQPPKTETRSDGDGIAPGEYPRALAEMREQLSSGLSRVENQMTMFVHGQASQKMPQVVVHNSLPATEIRNEITVPTPEVRNEINVPAAQVHNEITVPTPEVRNEINVPAAQVVVEAPSVNVTNNVPPAEVTVSLPDRKTETTILRDRQGNITNATQVETTIEDDK